MPERIAVHSIASSAPPVRPVDAATVAASLAGTRTVVVIDDDPTGTQTTAGLPVLTGWSVDDVRWAMRQSVPGFFILTNTRGLSAANAARVTTEVARACAAAAELEGVDYAFVSRSDSTLRGHFPLETDVLADELARTGVATDGVIIVPAYIDAGRVTAASVHYLRRDDDLVPVGESEFAMDATFGYRSSDLRDWVEEKTAGAVRASDVEAITLTDLRGDAEALTRRIASLTRGRVAVVDALTDDDLRALSLALIEAEREGRRFIYRVGPSFVRARLGQDASAPIAGDDLARIVSGSEASTGHGLVVVGSHTALTTGQLERLRAALPVTDLELDVNRLRDAVTADATFGGLAERVADELRRGIVVLSTSRTLVTGADGEESLAFSRLVSGSLVRVVREALARVRPAFVVAKGGITSSDIATEALGIVRARTRGTLLPGIVSLWEPLSGPADGIPYVVFAGNVGGEQSLADVVAALNRAADEAAGTNERVS